MVEATVEKMHDGYIISVTGKYDYGKVYLSKYYKGKYAYMCDYAYAKRFRDKKTALKHAKKIMGV